MMVGRSREGAWIEIGRNLPEGDNATGRSREGAWIEMPSSQQSVLALCVAPVRERGLKYYRYWSIPSVAGSRSREGAWIEI